MASLPNSNGNRKMRQPLSAHLTEMSDRHASLRDEEALLRAAAAAEDPAAMSRMEAISTEMDTMQWRLDEDGDAPLAAFTASYDGVDPETLPAGEARTLRGARGLMRL